MTRNIYRGTRVEIDLDNLAFNIRNIRKLVDDTMIMAVVKANAYGHGAISASRTFLENGANMLAVSMYQEGMELRRANIDAPILVFNYVPHYEYERIVKDNLTLSIYNYEDALALSHIAEKLGKKAKVHIKIDTGMGRIGLLPNDQGIQEVIKISKLPYIDLEGIYSHFSSADEDRKEATKKQYNKFKWFIKNLKDNNIDIPIKHISNSAGIIDHPEYNLDMVRPGIILYGYYPSDYVNKSRILLRPAMTFKTNIAYIKKWPKSTGIGYNKEFVTKRESIIATLPVGYADGYYRLLTGKGKVSVNGWTVPVIGKICMDQMMIDVTDIKNIKKNDEVVLFGYKESNYPHIKDISRLLGTTFYEVISIISRRVPRIYFKNGRYNHKINYVFN